MAHFLLRTSSTIALLMCCIATAPAEESSPTGIGLSGLPILGAGESRMVSPENPTGEKGKGAMAVPDPKNPDLPASSAAARLGQGWKVRPFVQVPAHSTITIMDVAGAQMPAGNQAAGPYAVGLVPWMREETVSLCQAGQMTTAGFAA